MPGHSSKIYSQNVSSQSVAYISVAELLPSVRSGIRETYEGPFSIAEDMMVWNITKDKVTERMAVSPDRAWPVPGPTVQPPPEKGRPDPMSDFIKKGEWGPAFNAQNEMLDDYARKYKLENQDWRKQKPWYKPGK